ncbi:unnamed protein product, partial [Adineta ricciae]
MHIPFRHRYSLTSHSLASNSSQLYSSSPNRQCSIPSQTYRQSRQFVPIWHGTSIKHHLSRKEPTLTAVSWLTSTDLG